MSDQQLHIQTNEGDHTAMLCSTVMAWTEKEADMYLVSEEGYKIYTHRSVSSCVWPVTLKEQVTGSWLDKLVHKYSGSIPVDLLESCI